MGTTGAEDAMDDSSQPAFQRELPDYITVTVEGVILGVDSDVADHPPARVAIVLPDYVADGLAHLIAQSWWMARLFDSEGRFGLPERALSRALFDAASGTYRCPDGGLDLPGWP
jgi:hypothetical protein